MPWYRMEARHGPGHQGRDVEYEWSWEELSEPEQKDAWVDWVTRNFWHESVGGVSPVEVLPQEVREEKIQYYRDLIEDAQEMLSILAQPRRASE